MIIQSNFNSRTPGGGLGCLIFGVLGLVAAFFILKGLFNLLWVAAPFLFVLTLLINWRTVPDTVAGLLRLIRERPLVGILTAVLAGVAFPFTALYLFLGALGSRQMKRFQKRFGGANPSAQTHPADKEEFIDFEEIESRPAGSEQPLEAPPEMEKQPPKKTENPYDDLFKP